MINFLKHNHFSPFRSTQQDFASEKKSTEKVHESKIKRVVVENFLASLPKTDDKHSSRCRENIKTHLKATLKHSFYRIPCHHQPLADNEILNWFVNGALGQKLHRLAVVNRDKDVESFLRKAHVDVNQPDKKTGDTPLILAARIHDADTVKELLGAKADISARSKIAKDAIYEALENINRTNFRDDQQFETIKCLLEHGADVNQRLLHRPTTRLSEYAIPKSELRVAKLLISHSKSIKTETLHQLAKVRSIDSPNIIRHVLFQPKFDPKENPPCDTPLMAVYINGEQQFKEVLFFPPDIPPAVTYPKLAKRFGCLDVACLVEKGRLKEVSELLDGYGPLKEVPKLPKNVPLIEKILSGLNAGEKTQLKKALASKVVLTQSSVLSQLFNTSGTKPFTSAAAGGKA